MLVLSVYAIVKTDEETQPPGRPTVFVIFLNWQACKLHAVIGQVCESENIGKI